MVFGIGVVVSLIQTAVSWLFEAWPYKAVVLVKTNCPTNPASSSGYGYFHIIYVAAVYLSLTCYLAE
jgi:hypothetical protein